MNVPRCERVAEDAFRNVDAAGLAEDFGLRAAGQRGDCDEMTGIQALERAAPDQPMHSGQPARQEFEYARPGTTTMIGNWDVVAGATFCNTIGPTRTEDDFVAHIAQTVAGDPQGK